MAEHPSTSTLGSDITPDGSSTKSDVTLPPDYTETDIGFDIGVMIEAGQIPKTQPNLQPTSPSRTMRPSPEQQSPQQEDLVLIGLKGMIPLTMNTSDSADVGANQFTNPPEYSIYTDPLLKENADSDKTAFVGFLQKRTIGTFNQNKNLIWKVFTGLILAGYTLYIGFAIAYSPYGAIAPLVFTGLALLVWVYYAIKKQWGKQIYRRILRPINRWWNGHWDVLRW
jgi:hypothetical protein